MPPPNIEELIIYELHVGALGYPSTSAGTFADAMAFVDQLADLGVNAVELLPVLEFDGALQWGYGTSLFFCLQTSAGGGNQLKHFVRGCHQRGIAVILDVVYNHFAGSGSSRSEWGYDCDPDIAPQDNTWYWYQGLPTDQYPGTSNWRLPRQRLLRLDTALAKRMSDRPSPAVPPCCWTSFISTAYASI